MNPLTIFPQILFLGPGLAPLLLRLFVGGFLVYEGRGRFGKAYKWSAVAYAISGLLVIFGIYTQPAAILGILVLGFNYYADTKTGPMSTHTILLHILCALVLLTLLFTGPGFFAFDLPL